MLLAKWQGPFEVTRQGGPVDYEISLPGHQRDKRVYHMNLLKAWKEQEGLMITPYSLEPKLGSLADESAEPGPVTISQELDLEQQESYGG